MIGNFPVEEIPGRHRVFHRVHRAFMEGDEILPGAFRDSGKDPMSVDWEKYSTAEQTRQRARKPPENAVVSVRSGVIQAMPELKLGHEPLSDNRAHCRVYGEKTAKVRIKLVEAAQVEIRIST